jgi:hypothetical protein
MPNPPSPQTADSREAQCDNIKKLVKATFEKLLNIENILEENQKIKAVLKRDLTDMAEGRIDRILERQSIDEVSKKESVFTVKMKVEVGSKTSSPWYVPYIAVLDKTELAVNNSASKTYAKGSYKLDNGEIRYL